MKMPMTYGFPQSRLSCRQWLAAPADIKSIFRALRRREYSITCNALLSLVFNSRRMTTDRDHCDGSRGNCPNFPDVIRLDCGFFSTDAARASGHQRGGRQANTVTVHLKRCP